MLRGSARSGNCNSSSQAQDIRSSIQSVRIEQDGVRIAEQQRAIAQLEADQAEQLVDFLSSKFTNAALYDWMSRVIERAYRAVLQHAVSSRSPSRPQLAFERPAASRLGSPTISGAAPNEIAGAPTETRGITGAERLLLWWPRFIVLLGSRGLEKHSQAIADHVAHVPRQDESQPDAAVRCGCAIHCFCSRKMLVRAQALLKLIMPRTSAELATGIVDAVALSTAPQVAENILDALAGMTPAGGSERSRLCWAASDWTAALIGALEKGLVRPGELSLDQKQALAAHPDKALAARASQLLSRGGGLPNPDRQKVIDELGPLVLGMDHRRPGHRDHRPADRLPAAGAAAYYLSMGPITQHGGTAEAHLFASVDLGQDGAPWSYEGRFAMRKTPPAGGCCGAPRSSIPACARGCGWPW